MLLGPSGQTLAVYRKIHLFDIDLPGLEHLKESRSVAPGTMLVEKSYTWATPWLVRAGMTSPPMSVSGFDWSGVTMSIKVWVSNT